MKAAIEKTIKAYLKAIYQQDLETVFNLLYYDDILEYKTLIEEFAEKMDPFGETEDFLKKLGVKDLQEIKNMSPKEFMFCIFQTITREVGEKELKKMINGTRILDIDQADVLTNVKYEMVVNMWGEFDTIQTELNMIHTGGEWKILFKSGMRHGLKRFQKDIDEYYERKAKDKIPEQIDEDEISTYTISGYKDSNGEVMIEARFKDAGQFSEGLAYVKILSKYGYINLKGEIAIKPQYQDARGFMEGMAGVKLFSEEEDTWLWGFINKKGKVVVPPQFEEISFFSERLCAVKKEDYWGFINKKGKEIIPFKFEEAMPFEGGLAEIEVANSKGELVNMTIDKKGRLVD